MSSQALSLPTVCDFTGVNRRCGCLRLRRAACSLADRGRIVSGRAASSVAQVDYLVFDAFFFSRPPRLRATGWQHGASLTIVRSRPSSPHHCRSYRNSKITLRNSSLIRLLEEFGSKKKHRNCCRVCRLEQTPWRRRAVAGRPLWSRHHHEYISICRMRPARRALPPPRPAQHQRTGAPQR